MIVRDRVPGPQLPPPPRWELWWDHRPGGQYCGPGDSRPGPPLPRSSGWALRWCWEPPGTRTASSCSTRSTCSTFWRRTLFVIPLHGSFSFSFYLLTEILTLVDLTLSDLAGSKLWVWRRLIWTRKECRIWNLNIFKIRSSGRGRGEARGSCYGAHSWTFDYRFLNLKTKISSFFQNCSVCGFTYLLVTETVKQGSKETLKGCKKSCSEGPERKVGDIRLWET